MWVTGRTKATIVTLAVCLAEQVIFYSMITIMYSQNNALIDSDV